MNELFSLPVLLGIIYSGVRLATPICMLPSAKPLHKPPAFTTWAWKA